MSDLLIAAIIVFLIVVTAFWIGALGYRYCSVSISFNAGDAPTRSALLGIFSLSGLLIGSGRIIIAGRIVTGRRS
jgi:hypothetical protein